MLRYREAALDLLKRGWPLGEESKYDTNHALVLCRMHGFSPGLRFLYEHMRLFREVLQVCLHANLPKTSCQRESERERIFPSSANQLGCTHVPGLYTCARVVHMCQGCTHVPGLYTCARAVHMCQGCTHVPGSSVTWSNQSTQQGLACHVPDISLKQSCRHASAKQK